MLGDAGEGRLDGLHVLVAEDDHVQCDGIVACITDFGATVVGPAYNLTEAHQLITSNSIDVAVVDIDLGDGDTFDFARTLQSQGLPFIFATGYNCRKVPVDFEHVKCLEKPFTEHALVNSLVEAVSETRH
jgi:CheY-like chemotaxis protein